VFDTALVPLQSGGGSGGGAGTVVFALLALVVVLLPTLVVLAGYWLAFEKAGEPGWAAIVPVYNVWVLVRISGNEWYWFLGLLVPVVNLFVAAKVFVDLAGQFGRGLAFGIATWILPFLMVPLLGFGDYQYDGGRGGGAGRSAGI